MKKRHIGILPLLFMAIPIFAATIRVYNKLGNNKKITVTAITPQKRIVEPIESMRTHFFNTWFHGIEGFEWEANGTTYSAPVKMRALQTEGRLYIKKDGKYSFQPCLPCKLSQGDAQVIKSATPATAPAPAPPPPPPVPSKNGKKMAPVNPTTPERKRPQDGYLEEIQKGKKLRKVEPTTRQITKDPLLQEIESGKALKKADERTLAPKPDTRSARDKHLENIKKGISLRKTAAPQTKAPVKHELQDPLSKAIDERRKQLQQIEESQVDDEDEWADEDYE